eukprot:scaffold25384_cov129-Isochrysis_galbana.AAC.12
MGARLAKCRCAELHKGVAVEGPIGPAEDIDHLASQLEGCRVLERGAAPGRAAEHESKVDVDEMALSVEQDIAIVSIFDSKNVSGHRVSGDVGESAVPRSRRLAGTSTRAATACWAETRGGRSAFLSRGCDTAGAKGAAGRLARRSGAAASRTLLASRPPILNGPRAARRAECAQPCPPTIRRKASRGFDPHPLIPPARPQPFYSSPVAAEPATAATTRRPRVAGGVARPPPRPNGASAAPATKAADAEEAGGHRRRPPTFCRCARL